MALNLIIMKFKLYTRCLLQRFRMLAMLVLFISFWQYGQAQVTVLPTNGTGSPQSSPQGALRFQRAFYLITPAEMQASGIGTNTNVNSIGFTLGFPQSFTTKGAFNVYLKNTTDNVGRSDTTWTTVEVMNGADTSLTNLVSSDYEWQVKANCSPSSAFSPSGNFSTANLSLCQPPSNAITTNIGTTTATFEWNAPSSIVDKYYVRYSRLDVEAWTLDSTNTTSYNAINLVNGKSYQWRVFAACASGKSDSTGSSFATASSACGTITGMSVGTVTGTTAQLTWNIVPEITSYTVRFRRAGTEAWYTTNALTNSTTIDTFLVPGTRYEWAVNAFCASGSGIFSSGTPFTTTGTAVCYTPEGLAISNITATSSSIRWTAVTGASSYTVRYRAKNVISWTNAISGMTEFALNDSLVIPATTGKYSIPLASDFNYTGGGVYVAWEYSYKTGDLPQGNISLSTDQNAVLLGVNGQDSVNLLRSFVASGDTSLPALLPSTKSRPETTFGSTQFADSVEVKNVYTLGKIAPTFTNDTIRTLISNKAGSSKPYTVNLTVKNALGDERYTASANITIGADTVQLVSFNNWAPTIMETDSIIVSIGTAPGENVTANNRNFYLQQVNGSLISYADNSPALAETGFDTTGGFILAKHKMTRAEA